MAKKRERTKKTTKTSKTEETRILDDKEYRDMKYMFLTLFIGGILFLGVYLIGFINILLN